MFVKIIAAVAYVATSLVGGLVIAVVSVVSFLGVLFVAASTAIAATLYKLFRPDDSGK